MGSERHGDFCWEGWGGLFPTGLDPKKMSRGSHFCHREEGKGLRNGEAEKPDSDGIVSSPGSGCA